MIRGACRFSTAHRLPKTRQAGSLSYKKLQGSAGNPATALEFFVPFSMYFRIALGKIVAQVDIHHAGMRRCRCSGGNVPGCPGNIGVLCDHLQVAIARIPPESLDKPERRFE